MAKKPNGSGSLIPDLPTWLPLDAWEGWLEMRKASRTPNTERALRIALGKLDALRQAGQPVEKVIDQSTERGWTTFYPYRDTTKTERQAGQSLEAASRSSGEDRAEPAVSVPKVPIPSDVREKMKSLIKGTRH